MTRLVMLLAAMCVCACAISVRPVQAQEQKKSVEIQKQFANIYEYLDPKSTIIKQAKRGDQYELVYAGTSWYQVRVKDRVGWLERRAGEVIDAPSARILGVPMGVFAVFLGLLVVTLFGVALLVYRQMNAEA